MSPNEPPSPPPSMPPPPPSWSSGGAPPPPPSATAPPGPYGAPPGPYGAPPAYGQGYGAPPGYGPGGAPHGWQQPQKPPRPAVPVAGWMMIGGAVVMLLGTFLPWLTFGGDSFNAWDLTDLENESSKGGGYTFLAVVMGGFGITTVAARRVLPVAILAVVFGAFSVLAILDDLVDLSDDIFGFSMGAGPWIVLIGAAAALAGAIWTLAVRRRW